MTVPIMEYVILLHLNVYVSLGTVQRIALREYARMIVEGMIISEGIAIKENAFAGMDSLVYLVNLKHV